jgi:hypothetical protein
MRGDAGVGKTTLWLAGLEQARERGYRVLCARASEAESVMSYGTVADLLGDVDGEVLAGLPGVQRLAADRVLLQDTGGGPATDQRVVAATMVSVVEHLSEGAPVVIGIDDLQWLDKSSQAAVGFVARRLRGRAGLLVTERIQSDRGSVASWLQLGTPDGIDQVRIRPLSIRGLHRLISARLGRAFPRPTMMWIAEVSGGNPFYALEMARSLANQMPPGEALLPPTLAQLVRSRIGDRVRYSHPLLAHGVYADTPPADRRTMHRKPADVLTQPELKARHLALAASSTDPELLRTLDSAASAARTRGAPAAAAELLGLAIKLGGDTPVRRAQLAEHHLRAGNIAEAGAVLAPVIRQELPGLLGAVALNLLAGVRIFHDSFAEAAELLERAVHGAEDNPLILVQTLLMLAFAQKRTGENDEALRSAELAATHWASRP